MDDDLVLVTLALMRSLHRGQELAASCGRPCAPAWIFMASMLGEHTAVGAWSRQQGLPGDRIDKLERHVLGQVAVRATAQSESLPGTSSGAKHSARLRRYEVDPRSVLPNLKDWSVPAVVTAAFAIASPPVLTAAILLGLQPGPP